MFSGSVSIIPARGPKQCGWSGRIMYCNVVFDDDDDVDYDDADDDVEDDDVEDDEVQEDDVEDHSL
jgi:hypothetical protein